VAITRTLENVDENHDTSFEPHFTLRQAVRVAMLFFRGFCLQSLVSLIVRVNVVSCQVTL